MVEKLHILLGGIMMTSMNIFGLSISLPFCCFRLHAFFSVVNYFRFARVGRVHALSLVGHPVRVPNFCASLLRGSV